MKPLLRKFSIQTEYSFGVQEYEGTHFYNQWHFHPELELALIEKGSGTRLIGNDVERYNNNELVLIGSNVPHLWQSDENCTESQSMVIHFLEGFGGTQFVHLPEMKNIKALFEKAQRGIIFEGKTLAQVSEMLTAISQKQGAERFISFLQILHILSLSQEARFLSNIDSQGLISQSDTERINQIYSFVLANFSENITIEAMSRVANLSPTSFCRYFKKCTNKTFVDFLIEVRINHACKQLIETSKPIGQIAIESGYNSLSNFNTHFKKIMKTTPLNYKKYYLS